MFKEKLAIIIPTKDRPSELKRLLESISGQHVKPVQIVIVDGGNMPLEGLPEEFPDLKIDYVRLVPASLTAQRNAGVQKLNGEVTLAAFFDDDIVLSKNSLDYMMKFWEFADADTAGASFNIVTDTYEKPTFLEKVFLVNADTPGRILPSGFQSKLCSLAKTIRVDWLLGGATVWRKNIFDEFAFDEWYSGYARYEDVDFSYRVGKKYKMFVVADAGVKHLNSLESLDFSFSLGKMQIVNRLYFVKKNPGLSVFLCYWACFGLLLNNLIKSLLYRDKRYLLRTKGNVAGFVEILSNKDPHL